MSGTLVIGGVQVKAPQEFSVGIQDIDGESGRDAQGNMYRDRVAVKAKLDCKWGPLSDSEAAVLLTSVKDSFFTVSYPDPELGGQSTKTFYVGDRTMPSYSWNDKFNAMKWESLSMNFVEQ